MTEKQKEILDKIVSKTPSKWIEESNKRFEEKESKKPKSMFEEILDKLKSDGWEVEIDN
jgi:hypothetical protein